MSTKEWLSDRLESPEFQRLLEREDFIERYLDEIESLMDEKGVSRSDLARRMNCSRANITQMFRRTKNLTAESMVDLRRSSGLAPSRRGYFMDKPPRERVKELLDLYGISKLAPGKP